MVTHTPAESDRVALYLRVAASLRQAILQGRWKLGDQIPTIDALMAEYGVSRITIRQALGLLARDGLVVATRGRGTHVARTGVTLHEEGGLRSAISDPLELGEGQTIRILTRERLTALPELFGTGLTINGALMRVTKLHLFRGEPFMHSDVVLPASIHARFPRGADRREKVLKLLIAHGDARIDRSRQEITITFADDGMARHLGCAPMAPLVQIRSWRFDAHDVLVFSTRTLYRGDRFIYDITERNPDLAQSRTLVIPSAPRTPRER